jgi:hypothetical protein
VARGPLVAVRPKESQQPVAANGTAGRSRDEREQGDTPLLRRTADERLIGTGKANGPKKVKAIQHISNKRKSRR